MSLAAADTAKHHPGSNVQDIAHDQLRPSPLNPRKHPRSDSAIDELAASIADKGVLQNLVARPTPEQIDGRPVYEIAAGEGRWRAVGRLIERGAYDPDGNMPVSVRPLSDEQLIEIGLIENLQRSDLHPLDEGQAYSDLYDLALKRGGKKAGANAVRELAERIHKTPRFIQKRIKLVTGLDPAAAELFADGAMTLAVAQTLSTADAKRQTRVLDNFKGANGSVDVEGLRLLTPDDLEEVTGGWRRLSAAAFERAAYKGAVEEINGVEFAVDGKAFDKLQKKVAEDLASTFRDQAKAGEIAFFDVGNRLSSWSYKKSGDDKGGVFLEFDAHDGICIIHTGLKKTKDKLDAEQREKEYAARARASNKKIAERKAKPVALPKPDPRVPQTRKFLLEHPSAMLAVRIFQAITVNDQVGRIQWLARDYSDGHQGAKVRAALAQIKGFPRGNSATTLAWLLGLKAETLLPVWAVLEANKIYDLYRTLKKVPAPDATLFLYCGAMLPAEKAAAPSTAKKKAAAKAKAKAKGGKK